MYPSQYTTLHQQQQEQYHYAQLQQQQLELQQQQQLYGAANGHLLGAPQPYSLSAHALSGLHSGSPLPGHELTYQPRPQHHIPAGTYQPGAPRARDLQLIQLQQAQQAQLLQQQQAQLRQQHALAQQHYPRTHIPPRHQPNAAVQHYHQTIPAAAGQYQPQVGGGQAYNPDHQMKNPNEVFVGDLSFFCEEKDLFELFSQYGRVESCRIVMNDSQTKSLMFGFVCLSSPQEAATSARVLNNHPFMGRYMKVEVSEKKTLEQLHYNPKKPTYFNGYQIHVSFASTFSPHRVVKPTEFFLRKHFIQFGMINDIVIREYTIHQLQNKQEGYGFITYESEDAAVLAATQCSSIIIEGIVISCKLSYRNKALVAKQQMLLAATGQLGAANVNGAAAPPSLSAIPSHVSPSPVAGAEPLGGQYEYQQQASILQQQQQQLRNFQLPPQPRPVAPRPLANPQLRGLAPPLPPHHQQQMHFGIDPRAVQLANQQALQNKAMQNFLVPQQQQQVHTGLRLGESEESLVSSLFSDPHHGMAHSGTASPQDMSYLASASSDSSHSLGSGSMFSGSSALKSDLDSLPSLSLGGYPTHHSGSGSIDDLASYLQQHNDYPLKESSPSSWMSSSLSMGVAMQDELVAPGSPILVPESF